MSDTGGTETKELTTAEADDDEDGADSHSEASKVSSASAPYSTSERSHNSTKSLTESILTYSSENGRHYCNETYFMPNDDTEQTRLNILHQVYLMLLDGELTTAPLPRRIQRVLDVGTGPGDWAITMGEKYCGAEVIATDISVFQPTDVPRNVLFQIDDATEEWTFTQPFDFIHLRNLSGAFSDWGSIYMEAYKHLKPGGYLEIAEFEDIQMPKSSPNSYVSIFAAAVQAAAEKAGTPVGTGHLKRSLLEGAGFRNVRTTILDVPIGTWPKDTKKQSIGKMWLIGVLEGLEATSLRLLTREMNWNAQDVRELCDKVKAELVGPKIEAKTPFHFVVARKPFIAL
ncbi:MAG: hypothetical protein M1830_004375 [Pleopsidium flavum]|nr:MAG: hypothetical protein M1830_004375 [Pleopsidium flavum]